MAFNRLTFQQFVVLLGLGALCFLTSLGKSSRLSYHEAIWAQSAREMLERGDWLVPSLDHRPWLEKPPLGVWPIALIGWFESGVNETVARLPSALAALGLMMGVAALAQRHFGPAVGLLAGATQATSIWLVSRGRLAEVDVTLACLVTWSLVAFDRVRAFASEPLVPDQAKGPNGWQTAWVWAFFTLLGLTALAKGVGFGAVLVLATVTVVLAWDRDRSSVRALVNIPAGCWTLLLALAWPLAILSRYPEAFALWLTHVTDRVSARSQQFAGEPLWGYALSYFWQTLPWTPIAAFALRPSARLALQERRGLDRLLWAWAVVPAFLVSLASARNAHYLIYALPPWSIWAARGLVRLGHCLQSRGFAWSFLHRVAVVGMVLLGLGYAVSFGWVAPRFDHRGAEWRFYEQVNQYLERGESLTLVYDWPDWDRYPYLTPFGPIPHDLPVRLFYLERPVSWRLKAGSLVPDALATPFAVIGREHDANVLSRIGHVEVLARGPHDRVDRAYVLYRVTPTAEVAAENVRRQ